jgi:tetratricopeptide (TPR) repeat protein
MLLLTIAVVAILDHLINASRKKRQKRKLERFLSRFDSANIGKDYKALLTLQPDSLNSLTLLAAIYFKSGQYAESIHIYLALLEIATDKTLRIEAMVLLGKSYHKAGFYQRSRDVLLEALKLRARNSDALELLLVIYEQTKAYVSALEILDALEEMGKDVGKERSLLKAKSIAEDRLLSIDARYEALRELLKEDSRLFRLVFEFALVNFPQAAWRTIDEARVADAKDIFWRMPKASFDENEALKHRPLAELYSAKGWINAANESSVFEFDALIKLGEHKTIADLEFEYRCERCMASFPAHFYRCPSCQSAIGARIEPILVKNIKDDKESYENSANFY